MFKTCLKQCCVICVKPKFNKPRYNRSSLKIKAGILAFYKNKILLVQSYNDKWGIPKGEIKSAENLLSCAKREFEEETLINLSDNLIYFFNHTRIFNTHHYTFITVLKDEQVNINFNFLFDTQEEITGIGFIDLFCSEDLINFNLITGRIFKCFNKRRILENEFFRMFQLSQITIMVVKKKTTFTKVNIKDFFKQEEVTTSDEKAPKKQQQKVQKVCTFFLNGECKKGDECKFLHQKIIKKKLFCFKFQNNKCKFADSECEFYHDIGELAKQECKFGKRCTNENCILTHNTIYCKFGISCTKDNCIFEHTCKYNLDCVKKDNCIFYHDEPKEFEIIPENFPTISPQQSQHENELTMEENKKRFDTAIQTEIFNPDPNFFEITTMSDFQKILENKEMFDFTNMTFKIALK